MKNSRKTVVYSCPYIPPEWIVAHGLEPRRIAPAFTKSDAIVGGIEGLCPYVRSFINASVVEKGACCVVLTTVCDQMRHAFDIIVQKARLPVFLFNVPKTWQRISVHKLYQSELERLGKFLVYIGGKRPSKSFLAKTMQEYDAARKCIRSSRVFFTPRQYSEAIAKLNQQGKTNIKKNASRKKTLSKTIPLAIVGSPLPRKDFNIFNKVEKFRGSIVLDATETGERTLCPPYDRSRLRKEPLTELAEKYFVGIFDPFRRPNYLFYEWLKRELAIRQVRGIILRRYVWCDIWHAELYQLKQVTNLPVLDIEVTDNVKSSQLLTTQRIQTFLENLR